MHMASKEVKFPVAAMFILPSGTLSRAAGYEVRATPTRKAPASLGCASDVTSWMPATASTPPRHRANRLQAERPRQQRLLARTCHIPALARGGVSTIVNSKGLAHDGQEKGRGLRERRYRVMASAGTPIGEIKGRYPR